MNIISDFKNKYLNTQSFNYFFAATTIGSGVAGITSVALMALSGEPQKGNKFLQKIILYSRIPSLLALGALPFATIYFSNQVVGTQDRHCGYCPMLAALSGWAGSSASIGASALMSQADFFKNISLFGRYGIASKVGSLTSFGIALIVSESVKRVKSNRH